MPEVVDETTNTCGEVGGRSDTSCGEREHISKKSRHERVERRKYAYERPSGVPTSVDVANDALVHRLSKSVHLSFFKIDIHFFLMFLQMCHEQSKCVVWGNTLSTDIFIAKSESVIITYGGHSCGKGMW